MHYIEQYYNNTIKYELLNRFHYPKTKKIPKLEKIILNFGAKTFELKKLSVSLLALQIITKKKGTLTTSKKPNIILKIRKGNPVGCKVVLTKLRMYNFFEKLFTEVLPKLKKQTFVKNYPNKNSLTYNFENTFIFKEVERNYLLFNTLKNLQICFLTGTETVEELFFLLNSLKIVAKMTKSLERM